MGNSTYNKMWEDLGINLKNHEGLLGGLSKGYSDVFLSQKNRPESMGYFDFVISEVHGLRVKELMDAKENGQKVIGSFCIFVPEELILASNSISIGLCTGADVGSDEAEKYIPRNTCALIKSFMGFKLAGVCPYLEAADLLVGETTCDGKKKAYESFNEITGNVYVMEVPNTKSDKSSDLWRSEVLKFKEKLEELTGNEITVEKLNGATKIVNNKRRALQRLSDLRKATPAPISGLDALLINQISFYDDPIRFTENVNKLCDELDQRVVDGIGVFPKEAKKIIIGGSPMALPNWKLHHIIETSGAVVIGEEACVGERNFRELSEENITSVSEGINQLSSRYLTHDCACFTPNDERLDNASNMMTKLNGDGYIHYSLQFCTPFTMEAKKVQKRFRKDEYQFLELETDYSMEDAGQLKTRIEAFIEMLD